jgi:hypothetical protein
MKICEILNIHIHFFLFQSENILDSYSEFWPKIG